VTISSSSVTNQCQVTGSSFFVPLLCVQFVLSFFLDHSSFFFVPPDPEARTNDNLSLSTVPISIPPGEIESPSFGSVLSSFSFFLPPSFLCFLLTEVGPRLRPLACGSLFRLTLTPQVREVHGVQLASFPFFISVV